MKRNLGIGLLIIINLLFAFIIIWGAIFSYGIIVGPITNIEIINNITRNVMALLFLTSVTALVINYLLLRNLIASRNPLMISFVIVFAVIIVFLPFFFNARQSLIDYQQENAKRSLHNNRQ